MAATLEDQTFALEQYDTLLQVRPNDIDLWLGKAGIYKKSAVTREQELVCYEKVLEISPHNTDAAYTKLEILVETAVTTHRGTVNETTRKADANECYAWLQGWDKSAPDIFYKTITTCAAGNYNSNFLAADFYYGWALEIWPNHLPTLLEKMKLYASYKKREEAIEFCDDKIKRHYKEAWPWYLRGFLHSKLGEFNEAIGCFDEALKLKLDTDEAGRPVRRRSYHRIIKDKVSALESLGRHAEAAGILGAEVGVDPQNLEYLVWRGSLLTKAGLPEQAAQAYEQALKISSRPDVWLGKARLHKEIAGKKFWQWWEHRRAVNCYQKARQPDGELEELAKEHSSRTTSALSTILTGGLTGALMGLAVAIGTPLQSVAALAGGVLGSAVALPFHLNYHKKSPAMWYGLGALVGLFGAGVGWAIGANTVTIPCYNPSCDPMRDMPVLNYFKHLDAQRPPDTTWLDEQETITALRNYANRYATILTHHVRGALLAGTIGTLIGTPIVREVTWNRTGTWLVYPFIGAAALGWPLSLFFGWGWGGIGGGLLGGLGGFVIGLGIDGSKKAT